MKTRFFDLPFTLLLLLLTVTATSAKAQYTNASLDGPWLCLFEDPNDTTYFYLKFDGNGTVDQFGIFGMGPGPAGTYNMNPDGSFTGTIPGQVDFFGQLANATEGDAFVVMGTDTLGPIDFLEVESPNALAGTWTGTMVQDVSGNTDNVTFDIDFSGNIVANTGFTGPVYGTFCTEDGIFVAHVQTDEQDEYGEFHVSGDFNVNTITARFELDCSGCEDGTISLTRAVDPNGVEERNSAMSSLKAFPSPFQDQVNIQYELESSETVNISVLDLSGRVLDVVSTGNQLAGSHTLTWNGSSLAPGNYFLVVDVAGRRTVEKLVKH